MVVSLAMDPRLNPQHFSLLILILLHGNYATQAQFPGPSPPSNSTAGFSTVTAVIFGGLVLLFFGIALFSLCYYQRNYVNDISSNRPGVGTAPTTTSEPGERRVQKGVDQSVLETFPIMEYAAVQKLGTVNGPLECAVCLSEFSDDELLKLLPGCCHVFHPECIDRWLENHITCPVCRADLSKPSVTIGNMDGTSEATGNGTATIEGDMVLHDGESGQPSAVNHPVDRFTLRLPRHVIKEIEDARKYRRSVSIGGYAYERKGSISGKSGRLRGIIRSFSSVLRREPDVGSRVFTLSEVGELPMNTQSIGSSSLSGENQLQRSPSNVSRMALLDRV